LTRTSLNKIENNLNGCFYCGVPNEAFNKKMSDVAKDKWNKIKNIYE
jgi:hypothetical protein